MELIIKWNLIFSLRKTNTEVNKSFLKKLLDSLLTKHSISNPSSACERDDLTQQLMHLEWNIFIKLIQEAVMPYLNYSFIIAEQHPACGLWNPGKIRCLLASWCWKPLLLSSWKMLSSVVIHLVFGLREDVINLITD